MVRSSREWRQRDQPAIFERRGGPCLRHPWNGCQSRDPHDPADQDQPPEPDIPVNQAPPPGSPRLSIYQCRLSVRYGEDARLHRILTRPGRMRPGMYSNLHVESRVILVTSLSSARDSIVNAGCDAAEKRVRGASPAASRSSRRTISPGEIECLKILRAPREGRVPDLLAILVEDRRVLRIFGAKYLEEPAFSAVAPRGDMPADVSGRGAVPNPGTRDIGTPPSSPGLDERFAVPMLARCVPRAWSCRHLRSASRTPVPLRCARPEHTSIR